jgi:hypothetical protein
MEAGVTEQAKTGVLTLDKLRSYDGLSFLKAMIDGTLPQSPMTALRSAAPSTLPSTRARVTSPPNSS